MEECKADGIDSLVVVVHNGREYKYCSKDFDEMFEEYQVSLDEGRVRHLTHPLLPDEYSSVEEDCEDSEGLPGDENRRSGEFSEKQSSDPEN